MIQAGRGRASTFRSPSADGVGWIGITNAAQIPELGNAWSEDVYIDVSSKSQTLVKFDAKTEPSSSSAHFLIVDLGGKFFS